MVVGMEHLNVVESCYSLPVGSLDVSKEKSDSS